MKYEFTGITKQAFGRTLHQIKALADIGHRVTAGDLGGWVEKEENLSHEGNAWVSGDAWVYGNAQVSGDAWVYGNAQVYGNARVYGNAQVYGNAWVSGNAWVYGNARVYGDARVCGPYDHVCIGPIGSRKDYTTVFRCEGGALRVACGCFRGTLDEFEARVREVHRGAHHETAYLAAIAFARAALAKEDPHA